jgi:NADH:ubiquinone oxidoreductase subunit 5 (subunit L)/multisubunit Na+/H+ antiporter MnhA subunit
VKFDALQQRLNSVPEAWGGVAALAGLLIFCGAMGKSAQFPLHVWLPDAMEGPTPVSALIHAATMVAAGVYMLCRVFFLFGAHTVWPEALSFLNGISALDIVAWIGGFTALIAALMAIQQDDIKRILAYSTLSQLGYMVMAVGLGGPAAAMYHLSTHACFKALLFLGAGSVIVACHHEQNIWKMGGLKKKLPVTTWTFLIAALALCGVPPFSGFFSKDEIIATASGHVVLFIIGEAVALLTTFYMSRLFLVAFLGAPAFFDSAPMPDSAIFFSAASSVATWSSRSVRAAATVVVSPFMTASSARCASPRRASCIMSALSAACSAWPESAEASTLLAMDETASRPMPPAAETSAAPARPRQRIWVRSFMGAPTGMGGATQTQGSGVHV